MRTLKWLLVGLGLLAVVYLAWLTPLPGHDWKIYRAGCLSLANPYGAKITLIQGQENFGVPWLYVALYPLALLPADIGRAVLLVVTIAVIGWYVRDPWKVLLVCLSAPFLGLAWFGQTEAVAIFGLVTSGFPSLFFLSMKPQGAFLVVLNQLNLKAALGMLALFGLSLLTWGLWPLKMLSAVNQAAANHSPFPWLVPLGVCALYAWYKSEDRHDCLLCLASLCFCPYWQPWTPLPLLASTVKEVDDKRWWVVVFVATWAWQLGCRFDFVPY